MTLEYDERDKFTDGDKSAGTSTNRRWVDRRTVLLGAGMSLLGGFSGNAGAHQTTSGQTADFMMGELIEGDAIHVVPERTTRELQNREMHDRLIGSYFIQLAIKNVTDEYQSLDGWVRSSGNVVDAENYAHDQWDSTQFGSSGLIAPGEVIRGYLAYDVSEEAEPVIAELDFYEDLFPELSDVTINLTEQANDPYTLEQTFDPEVHDVGTEVDVSDAIVTLDAADITSSIGATDASEGYEFVTVDVSIVNSLQETETVVPFRQLLLKDRDHFTYHLNWPVSGNLSRTIVDHLEIPPDEERRGMAAYVVEEDLEPLYWVFDTVYMPTDTKAYWQIR